MKTQELLVHNSLTGKKEVFIPLEDGYIGMYVCGPTVYSGVHLGNVRTFVSFDLIYRYLLHLGYRIRYVRNITDVGHLTDDGEDRMAKGARHHQLEPMEVAQKFTLDFHEIMSLFNALPPTIEPRASGHIPEQIKMVQDILDNGLAYEENGSVYFDTIKYAKETGEYGKLSGRKIDELLSMTREGLKHQDEKRHPADFAIWMKAGEDHIMRWESPWSVGFPGWHLECSAMSTKYLGKTFDIHGGGNDLKFPHHENEVAQNMGACQCAPARYWLHTNMLLMNGKKMSKSDGNTISPHELITGDSPHLTQGYTPDEIRFFMLQTHYASTMDINDEALRAAAKGYQRLSEGLNRLKRISSNDKRGNLDEQWTFCIDTAFHEMNNDFNAPKAMARVFDLISSVNTHVDKGVGSIGSDALGKIQERVNTLVCDVFGLSMDSGPSDEKTDDLMELILELRQQVRRDKNWTMSDLIRDRLSDLGISVKDGKDGSTWTMN